MPVGDEGQPIGQGHGREHIGGLDARPADQESAALPVDPGPVEVELAVGAPAHVLGRLGPDHRAKPVRVAHHLQEGGAGEELEADVGRDRIAGQPEGGLAAHEAEGQGLGRLDGHLGPAEVAHAVEDGLDQVVVPD